MHERNLMQGIYMASFLSLYAAGKLPAVSVWIEGQCFAKFPAKSHGKEKTIEELPDELYQAVKIIEKEAEKAINVMANMEKLDLSSREKRMQFYQKLKAVYEDLGPQSGSEAMEWVKKDSSVRLYTWENTPVVAVNLQGIRYNNLPKRKGQTILDLQDIPNKKLKEAVRAIVREAEKALHLIAAVEGRNKRGDEIQNGSISMMK